MKIILGSGSKSRRKYFSQLGYEFEVMTPNVDERAIRLDDPKALTLALAQLKTEALLPKIKEPAILVTADQVVWWNNRILEKPKNAVEVRAFLQGYAHGVAQPVNGVVVTNTKTKKQARANDRSDVYFKPIPEDVIEQLIEQEEVFLWGGAFSLDNELLKPFIERIEGTLDSIEGLPLKLTKQLIGAVM